MIASHDAPATKEDIRLLMEEIGKLYMATEQWKTEIIGKMQEWKTEIVHEFHIVAENMRHDYLGAHKDRIENHEDRLRRLERRARFVA